YFQSDNRNRRTVAEDLRLVGDPARAIFGRVRWLTGVYALRLAESDDIRYAFNDQYNGTGGSELTSRYVATSAALYGSLDADIGTRTTLSAGARFEARNAKYGDSADVLTPFPDQRNNMVGGNLSLVHHLGNQQSVYVTLARGYKGGGFNIGSQILAEQRSFG